MGTTTRTIAESLGLTEEEYLAQIAAMPKPEKFAGEIFIQKPYIVEVDLDK